jgi:hypothetical protein
MIWYSGLIGRKNSVKKRFSEQQRVPIKEPENHVDWQEKSRLARNYKQDQNKGK